MNIALIEFNGFHEECLYSQVAYLKISQDNNVFLICNYRLKGKIDFFDQIEDVFFTRSNQWGIGYIRILRFMIKNNIDKVVFNSTLYKPVTKLLTICSKAKRDYFGLIHDRSQLKTQQTYQLRKKIKGYFLLNDYLLNDIGSFSSVTKEYSSYYPIYFQDYKELPLEKKEGEIWIAIPGRMQKSRRDYDTLLESFKSGMLNNNVKLLFLGQSIFVKAHGQDVRQEFEKYDANNNCVFWDKFLDKDTFHTYIQMSDYILPLIHSNHSSIEKYKDKISGCFNLAFGYNLPMVMDSFFKQFSDFKDTALFYNIEDDIINVLNNLFTPDSDLIYNHKKWRYDFLSKKFNAFIQ